jgi:hypothetical protein
MEVNESFVWEAARVGIFSQFKEAIQNLSYYHDKLRLICLELRDHEGNTILHILSKCGNDNYTSISPYYSEHPKCVHYLLDELTSWQIPNDAMYTNFKQYLNFKNNEGLTALVSNSNIRNFDLSLRTMP